MMMKIVDMCHVPSDKHCFTNMAMRRMKMADCRQTVVWGRSAR
jgi:hypothetical protein